MAEAKHTPGPEPTIYQALKRAGVPLDNHESDLYAKDTETSRLIMAQYEHSFSGFLNQQDGQRWLDIPFAFDPWWDRRCAKI